MQKDIDLAFLKTSVPANNAVDEEAHIQALVCTLASCSDDQIRTLEDEINFYAFTGLMGSLMKYVFCSAPKTEVNHEAIGQREELLLLAS